jgi:Concanavalin A-like lectin/glucanases superfamily
MGLTTNLLAYWGLNDTSWADATGNGNDLIDLSNGNVTTVPGKLFNGAFFNGVDTNILYTNSQFNLANDFSVSFWFKFDSTIPIGAIGQFISTNISGQTGYESGLGFFYTSNDGANTILQIADISAYGSVNSLYSLCTYAFSSNTWYNITLTRSVVTGVISVYINGQQQKLTSDVYAYGDFTGSISIGGDGITSSAFIGTIDGVGIWNRVLTPLEANNIYNNVYAGSFGYINNSSRAIPPAYTPSLLPYSYLLPLTANASTLFLNQGFDIKNDIVISFDYACYGYSVRGGEGFSVVFSAASAAGNGGPGPGLCYSPVHNVSSIGGATLSSFPGLTFGAFGIGFDIAGNFCTNRYGIDGFYDPIPNSISIRYNVNSNYKLLYNSGDLASGNFPFNYNLYQQVTTYDVNAITYNRIRIRVAEFGQRLIIDLKRSNDTVFTEFVNCFLPRETFWPDTVFCGLGFATSNNFTIFKIKNFNVNGIFLTGGRTWSYAIDSFDSTLTELGYEALQDSYFTDIDGLTSREIGLATGWNFAIANDPKHADIPVLINITPNGSAGIKAGDKYIIIQ